MRNAFLFPASHFSLNRNVSHETIKKGQNETTIPDCKEQSGIAAFLGGMYMK